MWGYFILLVFVSMCFNQACGYSPWSLYCYRCVSTQPGCGTPFNWLWYWGEACPEPDDKCVKIIEQKNTDIMITRECLSTLRSIRTDIPADHYVGCRPAAKDVRLAHYVNNSIKELDVRRDYYDKTTWCFCYFDSRCNGASNIIVPMSLILSIMLALMHVK